MPKIWSYGFVNLDVVTQTVDKWPERSAVLWAENIEFKIGGVALNAAVAAAKLGQMSVGLIGYIGNDKAGQMVKSDLEKLGVDTTQLVIVDTQPTAICIVCVHPDGERSFIMNIGANEKLRTVEINIDALTSGDFFHFGGTYSIARLQALLKQLQNQQITVSIDLSADSTGKWDDLVPLFPHIDIFMANVHEIKQLTGTSDPVLAVQEIAAEGPKIVAIKLGGEGAYIFSKSWEGHIPAFKVEAIDTTGAGDSFAGSLLYGLARGWDTEQAATLANAVGALCTTSAGASDGIGSYTETIAFIREQERAGKWDWGRR